MFDWWTYSHLPSHLQLVGPRRFFRLRMLGVQVKVLRHAPIKAATAILQAVRTPDPVNMYQSREGHPTPELWHCGRGISWEAPGVASNAHAFNGSVFKERHKRSFDAIPCHWELGQPSGSPVKLSIRTLWFDDLQFFHERSLQCVVVHELTCTNPQMWRPDEKEIVAVSFLNIGDKNRHFQVQQTALNRA